MPRQARVMVDGGTYHIFARGNNGQTLFLQEADYRRYLDLLAHAVQTHDLTLYHYVLMPDHLHLVLHTPVGSRLSRAMRSLNLAYTWHYHKRYRYYGHLWQGRFRSTLLDEPRRSLCFGRSLEQHPVQSALVQEPEAYPWSSYQVYAKGADNPLIMLNPHYSALGPTVPERQERYRQLLSSQVPLAAPHIPLDRQSVSVAHRSPASLEDLWMLPITRRPRGRPRKLLAFAPRHIETSSDNHDA